MMRIWMILVTAFVVVGSPTYGKDDKAVFMGAGAVSCGEFAESFRRSTNSETLFFTWAQGYMSGLNLALKTAGKPIRDLRAREANIQKQTIRSYCNSHPLDVYMSAVNALFITLPERSM